MRGASLTHCIVTHSIVIDGSGAVLGARLGHGDHGLQMPRRHMSPTETPDVSALIALGGSAARTARLTGTHSHATQLPGAPTMLVRPHLMIWYADGLHLYYGATLNADGAYRLHDSCDWVSPDSLWEPELTAAGLSASLVCAMARPTAHGHRPTDLFDTPGLPSPARELSVAVFVNHGGKTLLHFHSKARMWLPPGGHVEAGETPDAAALREVFEETGLRVGLEGEYPQANAEVAQGSGAAQILARPQGVQIEELYPGHEHLDFVYFSRPAMATCGAGPTESGNMPGFGWYGPGDAGSIPLTPEMRLWCAKAWEASNAL